MLGGMKRYLTVAAVMMLACVASGAERGATQPAGADLNTPKKALMTFERLGADSHVDRAAFVYAATTDDEKKVAKALADVDLELAKLRNKASARFDREAGDRMVHALHDVTAEDIDAATEQIDGDKATVSGKGFGEPLPMVKANGAWKIDLAPLLEKAKVENVVAVCDKLVEVMERTEEELAADKYANVSLLERAVKRRAKEIFGD